MSKHLPPTPDQLRAEIDAQAEAERRSMAPKRSELEAMRRKVEARKASCPLPDSALAPGNIYKPVVNDMRQALASNALGDGLIFAQLFRERFACDRSGGGREWYEFAGGHWRIDERDAALGAVEDVAMAYLEAARHYRDEAAKAKGNEADQLQDLAEQMEKRAYRLRGEKGRRECLGFAAANPRLSLSTVEPWDADPYLLGVSNGVVDLRTKDFRPGRPDDRIVKVCPVAYDPAATCPTWLDHLDKFSCRRPELVAFLGRWFGYSALGLAGEEKLLCLYGRGSNGKGIIVSTLMEILGPYAVALPAEMLLDQSFTRSAAGPSPDVAALRGARLVACSEPDEDRRFAAGKLKWITSKDLLTAREPNARRSIQFWPTHSAVLQTNAKPQGPTQDDGFWRRIVLLSSACRFVDPAAEAPDPERHVYPRRPREELEAQLRAEAPGILNWLIGGATDYLRDGLAVPAVLRQETQEYAKEENVLAAFLDERCRLQPWSEVSAADLYHDFAEWFVKAGWGKKARSRKTFGGWMSKDDRFQRFTKNGVWYRGLELAWKE